MRINLIYLLFIGLFFSTNAVSQIDNTPSGGNETQTVPAGVSSVTVRVWGAGGAGGGSTGTKGGGGGASGAFSTLVFNVTPGDLITYKIGAGPTGTTGSVGVATVAQQTTLTYAPSSVSITCNGGNSGTGGTGGAGAGGTGGATASGGTTNTVGIAGGGGGTPNGGTGTGAPSGTGNTGAAGSGVVGSSGSIPGGGGGGAGGAASGSGKGGNGGNGQVEFVFSNAICSILGNGNAISHDSALAISPSTSNSTDFGNVFQSGAIKGIITYTVQNTGTSTLTLGAISFGGTNGTDFTVDTTFGTTSVAPGGSTTFKISFNPGGNGTRTGTISIVTNDGNRNPYKFNVKGFGIDPEISLLNGATSITSGAAASIANATDFGKLAIGTSSSKTLIVKNVGTAFGTLDLGTVVLSGADSSQFSITTSPANASLGVNGTSNLIIQFSPTSFGIKNAIITINHNDQDDSENPFVINIKGEGADTVANVLGNSISIVDGDTTPAPSDNTDFGGVNTTGGSRIITYTVTNTGTIGNLNLTAPTFSGTNAADFTISTALASTVLAPGASTTFSVKFDPSPNTSSPANGLRTATLNMITDVSVQNPYDFSLQGFAFDPEITVVIPNSAVNSAGFASNVAATIGNNTDFGNQPLGATYTKSLTIRNTNTSLDLNLSTITISGASEFAIATMPASVIPAGTETTITYTYTPVDYTVKTAVITIPHDDTDDAAELPNFIINLSGQGSDAEMDVIGNSISITDGDTTPSLTDNSDFGLVTTTGGTKIITYTVNNTGTGNLILGAITKGGTAAADYTVSAFGSTTVAPGGSTTFTVTFDPSANGLRSATLSIVTNDNNENPYNWSIQGTGDDQEIQLRNGADTVNIASNAVSLAANDTAFGIVAPGGSFSETIIIKNTSTSANLNIASAIISGASDFTISVPPASVVAPNSQTSITYTFTPSDSAFKTAIITINSDDADEAATTINLSGQASGDAEINVLGNGTSIVDGDITPSISDDTDFGGVLTTGGLKTITYTIQNLGTTTLDLRNLTITGVATVISDFTLSALSATSVAPGSNATFTITFNPSAGGIRAATLNIESNDITGGEDFYSWNIQGNGDDPEIDVKDATGNINILDNAVALSANGTAFGGVTIGSTVTKTLLIKNTNTNVTLNISSVTITGNSEFAITSMPAASVSAGGQTSISYSFSPIDTQIKTAIIKINHDDPDDGENPFDINLSGEGSNVEVNLVGNGNSIVNGDNTPSVTDDTDFGSTDLTVGSVTKVFTIQNTGSSTLKLGAVTKSGTNTGDFTVTTGTTAVAPGGSTTISINFNPAGVGVRSAVISIVSNDSDENPYTWTVQGTGTDPEIQVFENIVNIADGTGTSDFGNMDIALGTPITKTFTVKNIGSGTLTLGAISFSGLNASDFTASAFGTTSVAPNASTTFTVNFATASSGAKTATISFVNNDTNENPYDFTLTGKGSTNEIDVQGNGVSIVDEDTTPSLTDFTDFGSNPSRTYTILNTGDGSLTVGTPVISGTNASDFSITTLPASTVAGGASTFFVVTCNAITPAVRTATITFSNSDLNENPYNFNIKSTITAGMQIRGADNTTGAINSIVHNGTASTTNGSNFGNTDANTGVIFKTFTVLNTGATNLIISSLTLGGTSPSDFKVTQQPVSPVLPGQNTTFIIKFNPSAARARSATLTIVSNDATTPSFIMNLTGTGTNQEIEIQGNNTVINVLDLVPSLTDFTDFDNTNTSRTFTIFNRGTSALTIGAITFTGANPGDFSVSTPPVSPVIAGGNTTFTVTFAPTVLGIRSATINIVNSDTTNDAFNNPEGNTVPFTFGIQGTGIDREIAVTGINTVSGAVGQNIVSGSNVASPNSTNGTDFGTVSNLGSFFSTRTFTISNVPAGLAINLTGGASAFVFDTFAGTGCTASTFTILNAVSTSTINGGQSVTFIVKYNPNGGSAAVAQTCRISIANNDADEAPFTFFLKGTPTSSASTRLIQVSAYGGSVVLSNGDMAPSQAKGTDFGNTSIDSGSIIVTFNIKNTGTGILNIGSMTLTGANATEFGFVSNLNLTQTSTLAAGATRTLQLSFNPSTLGQKTATLNIASDDSSGVTNFSVGLTGLGFKAFIDTDADGVFNDVDEDDDNDGISDTTEQADCLQSPFALAVPYTYLNETFGFGLTRGQINVNTPLATTYYCFEDGIVGSRIPETTVGQPGFCFVTSTSDASYSINDGEYTVFSRIMYDTCTDFAASNNFFSVANFGCATDPSWANVADHTPGDTEGRMLAVNADDSGGGEFYTMTIKGIIPNAPVSFDMWVMNVSRDTTYDNKDLPNLTVTFYDLAGNVINTNNTGYIGRCIKDDPGKVRTINCPNYPGTTHPVGTPIGTVGNSCGPLSNWLNYTYTANLGDATGFIVKIANNVNVNCGGNDIAIDDIKITQNYCDLENDGVVCMYDLDSDDDGIPDAEENGYGTKMGTKSYLALGLSGSGAGYADLDGNGWRDDVANDLFNDTNPDSFYDADGDGVKNYLDHDSDNDGIFDSAEGRQLVGDMDVDDDGVADGLDSADGDGIVGVSSEGVLLDDLPNAGGYGTNAGVVSTDSDGDGIKDYLDIDSKTLDIDTNGDGILDLNTYDITNTIYADLDADNNGIIDGPNDITVDADRDGIMTPRDSDPATIGSPRNITKKCMLEFDGRNDYATDTSMSYSGLNSLTVMAWIDGEYSGTMNLFGQTNFNLRINSSRRLECSITTNTGTSLFTGTQTYSSNRWAHIAVSYDGANVKFYLNGVNTISYPKTGAIAVDASIFTIGKTPGALTNFFKGEIDEIRIFNSALTAQQIQRMINQEVTDNAGQVRGDIIPIDIGTLPYSNLLRYYKMDNYRDDIADNATTGAVDTGAGLKMFNHKNIKLQNAPLPFVTSQTGTFTTAVTNLRNHVYGADIPTFGFSIVNVKHDVTETVNTSTVGLLIDSGKKVIMDNNAQLQNDWYLKLDGTVDLQGKSQLMQTINSILEPTSAGGIERDQQGQASMYNYNYWCSPVGPFSNSTNNNDYTIGGVLKDGTDPDNIQNINWINGLDVTATSPISLTRRWLFKFQNTTSAYANWSKIDETTTLSPAQGFTMKGSTPMVGDGSQNYVFVGKPNNGTITLPIAAASSNLCGNPYPSALDANLFISLNPAIDGTIYYWDHFASNPSHVLKDYEGGYANYNLVGGTPPIAQGGLISSNGTTAKPAPKRYIPVGQAFFVNSTAGGTITFDNSMRAFIRENDQQTGNNLSFSMFRKNPSVNPTVNSINPHDPVVLDTHEKIRIGFNTHDNYHRQLLLGFMDELATSSIDRGYDGVHIDNQPNDMYFMNSGKKLNIQGEGFFNEEISLPLAIKTNAQGLISIELDAIENQKNIKDVYIYDDSNGAYFDLKSGKFETLLESGLFENRFYLRFKKENALSTSSEFENKMKFSYTTSNNSININNENELLNVTKITLISLIGQEIMSWKTSEMNQKAIELPVRNVSEGTYLVKISTTKGDFTKKIVVTN